MHPERFEHKNSVLGKKVIRKGQFQTAGADTPQRSGAISTEQQHNKEKFPFSAGSQNSTAFTFRLDPTGLRGKRPRQQHVVMWGRSNNGARANGSHVAAEKCSV